LRSYEVLYFSSSNLLIFSASCFDFICVHPCLSVVASVVFLVVALPRCVYLWFHDFLG